MPDAQNDLNLAIAQMRPYFAIADKLRADIAEAKRREAENGEGGGNGPHQQIDGLLGRLSEKVKIRYAGTVEWVSTSDEVYAGTQIIALHDISLQWTELETSDPDDSLEPTTLKGGSVYEVSYYGQDPPSIPSDASPLWGQNDNIYANPRFSSAAFSGEYEQDPAKVIASTIFTLDYEADAPGQNEPVSVPESKGSRAPLDPEIILVRQAIHPESFFWDTYPYDLLSDLINHRKSILSEGELTNYILGLVPPPIVVEQTGELDINLPDINLPDIDIHDLDPALQFSTGFLDGALENYGVFDLLDAIGAVGQLAGMALGRDIDFHSSSDELGDLLWEGADEIGIGDPRGTDPYLLGELFGEVAGTTAGIGTDLWLMYAGLGMIGAGLAIGGGALVLVGGATVAVGGAGVLVIGGLILIVGGGLLILYHGVKSFEDDAPHSRDDAEGGKQPEESKYDKSKWTPTEQKLYKGLTDAEIDEMKAHMQTWAKGDRFPTLEDSIIYHYEKHGHQVGARDPLTYLRKAKDFALKKPGKAKPIRDYSMPEGENDVNKWESSSGEYIEIRIKGGLIVTYGKN